MVPSAFNQVAQTVSQRFSRCRVLRMLEKALGKKEVKGPSVPGFDVSTQNLKKEECNSKNNQGPGEVRINRLAEIVKY